MPLRLFLPLLILGAIAAYAGGAIAYARWGDRPHAAKADAAAEAARALVQRIRAATEPALRQELLRDFRARYPESWLHTQWSERR
ncbi:MAG: hypothetical protein QNJ90_05035 [Planctomycetota bacterium]|nr:hypothetical protein [Planctomycetota bacterium]